MQDRRISVRVFDPLTDLPTSSVDTSEGRGWHGVLLRYFEHRFSGQLVVPGFTEDYLLVVDCHVAAVQGKVRQRFSGARPGPGDLYVIPRGEPTEWHWQGRCNVIQISPDPSTVARAAVETLDVEPARVELLPRITVPDPLVYEIGRAMLGELRAGAAGSRLYIDLLTQTLTVHLLRRHAAVPPRPAGEGGGLRPATLRRVEEYIAEHLAGDLRLADLAAVANLSQYHFARQFRRSTGESLHRYVVERRLDAARRLLEGGRHSVVEVAALTGFADQSHLHRLFKARYGVTPGALAAERTKIQPERTDLQDPTGHDPLP